MALAACLLGYGEVGLWLKKEAGKPDSWVKWEGNPYLKWMQDYAGEDFQNAVVAGLGAHVLPVLSLSFSYVSRVIQRFLTQCVCEESIEARAATDPPSPVRYAEWLAVWERCIGLEKGFWDMAMNLS